VGALPEFTEGPLPGRDSQSHVAKTAFLMYSFAHGNFTGWSQFWYSGFQLFYTYSPLTYVLAAVLGWPFNSALLGMKIVIALCFVLSGFGAYALSRDFGISPNWSLFAGVLYSLAPPHILALFDYGSSSYSLGFALAPFLFLGLHSALRKRTMISAIYLGTVAALFLISNDVSFYAVAFPFLAFVIIATPLSMAKRNTWVLLEAFAIAFLLSAFWLVPYLYYQIYGKLALIDGGGTGFPQSVLIYGKSLVTPNFGSFPAAFLSWILLFPALASILFMKKREEVALYAAGLVSIFLTIGPTITSLYYKLPFVLALEFPARFLIADVLFLSPLAALFFFRLFQRLSKLGHSLVWKLSALAILMLLVVVPIVEPSQKLGSNTWQINDPTQLSAFSFLANQSGLFRVMVIDQFYESFPQFTMKPALGGWYPQAVPQLYQAYLFDVYYCGANSSVLQGLRLMGVRYVMVDYGYVGDGSAAIKYYNSSASAFGPPVYENRAIAIYQVPSSQLIYVSSNPPNPLARNISELSQIASCGAPIPQPPSPLLNNTISNLNWQDEKISFDVRTSQAAYVTIASAYSAGWIALDNGTSTQMYFTNPDLPVLNVSSGLNHIELLYTGAPYSQSMAIVSLIAFLGSVVATPIFGTLRKKREVRNYFTD
jgi:hypothetical protein